MEQSLLQARHAARLRQYRVRTRLSEIQRRLKAQYDADTHVPISRRPMGLLDAIDRPQRGEMEPVAQRTFGESSHTENNPP
jgi:hypothetical protein